MRLDAQGQREDSECAMKHLNRVSRLAACACLIALLLCLSTARSDAQAKRATEDSPALNDFLARVNAYVKLRNDLEGSLPALKPTDQPEQLVERQQSLAKKIAEAREKAERGDVFTREARKEFRRILRQEFQGPEARHARKTIRQGEPLPEMHLRVNQVYPEKVPLTTVPPTLLLKLPALPKEVAFRIVGRDLVLHDVKANLIVDFIHEALP